MPCEAVVRRGLKTEDRYSGRDKDRSGEALRPDGLLEDERGKGGRDDDAGLPDRRDGGGGGALESGEHEAVGSKGRESRGDRCPAPLGAQSRTTAEAQNAARVAEPERSIESSR